MSYIQGADRHQSTLFPEVIDDYIDDDNPVRFIDAYIDSLNLFELGFTSAVPKETGRPSYHPGDMSKLYLYGYLNSLRSGRKLEKSTHCNIEVIWLMRKLKPDFKIIADFRKNNLKALKALCRNFILLCRKLELFGGELVAIDGSKFKAVNSSSRNYNKKKINRIKKEIDEAITAYLTELDRQDQNEPDINTSSVEELKGKIAYLKSHQEKIDQIDRQLQDSGQSQISTTDPDSRSMRTAKDGTDVCYNTQIVTDSKYKLIVEHEVTNDINDQNQLSNMAIKAQETLSVSRLQVLADMGYYSFPDLKKCSERNIECYVPKPARSNNKKLGLFTKDDFRYNAKDDCYLCPANQILTFRFQMLKSGKQTKVYTASACKTCALKAKCTRDQYRRIYRWVDEHLAETVEQRVAQYPEKTELRKQLVEHPFGTIKHWMNQGYFLMRGLEKVSTEMSLTVLAYNMKRVINIIGVKELVKAVS